MAYDADPWAQSYKIYSVIISNAYNKARVFVPSRPFHPSLMFVSKARSLP
jgi:hypothetical protein